jgi:hypothetical protein
LSVAALLAAMVLAMAVPAFADPGLQGHETRTGDFAFVNCDPFVQPCTGEMTFAGKDAGGQFEGGGRRETDITSDFTGWPSSPPLTDVTADSQGGGPSTGGGNCTTTSDGHTQSTDGVGPRCQ